MSAGFALQVHLREGGPWHLFGRGEQQRAEFRRFVEGWRSQPADAFYDFVGGDGPVRIWVRDITRVEAVRL